MFASLAVSDSFSKLHFALLHTFVVPVVVLWLLHPCGVLLADAFMFCPGLLCPDDVCGVIVLATECWLPLYQALIRRVVRTSYVQRELRSLQLRQRNKRRVNALRLACPLRMPPWLTFGGGRSKPSILQLRKLMFLRKLCRLGARGMYFTGRVGILHLKTSLLTCCKLPRIVLVSVLVISSPCQRILLCYTHYVAGFYTKGLRLKFPEPVGDDPAQRVSLTLLYFSTIDAIPCPMSRQFFEAVRTACTGLDGLDCRLDEHGVMSFAAEAAAQSMAGKCLFLLLLPLLNSAPLCPGAVSCQSGPDTALWAGMLYQQWHSKDCTLRATTLPALAPIQPSEPTASPDDICVRTDGCTVWLLPQLGGLLHRRCQCCSTYNSDTIPKRKAAAANAKLTRPFTILHTEVTLLLAATKSQRNTGSDSPVCERVVLASLMCCHWRVRSYFIAFAVACEP